MPSDLNDLKIVHFRALASVYPFEGALWISEADGSGARQLTPEGVAASFAGVVAGKSGAPVLYYVTEDREDARSVWQLDLSTDDAQLLFSFGAPGSSVVVSPDGRYIAFAHATGLAIFDLASGRKTEVLSGGDSSACLANVIAQCFSYYPAAWSPDGRLLLVTKGLYEGAFVTVIDPFGEPPARLVEGWRQFPSSGTWSPGGDAVCAFGRYADVSGLYVLNAPEWEPTILNPEFEDQAANPEGRMVVGCDWIDRGTVAFLGIRQTPSMRGELSLLDTQTGKSTPVATVEEEIGCCMGNLTMVPGESLAIAQFTKNLDGGSQWTRPAITDLATGAVTHVLGDGDFVAAAYRP